MSADGSTLENNKDLHFDIKIKSWLKNSSDYLL